MSCPVCGEYFTDFNEAKYSRELDIVVCEKCLEKIEEHHGIDGKYVVHKCKECKQVTGVDWVSYKKRGRPSGSKNTPKKSGGTRLKTLEDFEGKEH